MAVNKVVYGTHTLIDLTGDTITADKLRTGYTAHGANGEAITGTLKTSSLEPYILDLENGWIGKGDGLWTPQAPNGAYSDVYEVQGGHSYFLTLGAAAGTRFRVIFSEEDVSSAAGTVQGIAVNTKNYDNPAEYQSLKYTPNIDGYLVVQKDNAGVSGLRTYLYDMTEGWE